MENLVSLRAQADVLHKKIEEEERVNKAPPHLNPKPQDSKVVGNPMTVPEVKEKIQEIHKGIFELFPESMSKQTTLQMLETILMWVGTARTEY